MGLSRFLLLLLLVAAFLCSLCACASGRSDVPGNIVDEMFLRRRSTTEAVAPAMDPALPNSSFILAAERTNRRNPLDNFKRYDGGWNITNVHYWASVGYTAAPLFVISALWFVGFGLILMCICCYVCCCRRSNRSYSRTPHAFTVILLVIFTCAAIIGCALLYHAQEEAYKSWTGTLDYAVHQANTTAENLRNFSTILSVAKRLGVDQFVMSASDQAHIDEIQTRISTSANDLTRRVDDNSDKIHDLLDDVKLALIIVAAVMLLLTFVGFLISFLGLQFLDHILVVIRWILVTGTFILCGVFLILHNIFGDTCVSLDEWVHNPTSHTALDDILPCVDVATANATLYQSKETTFSLVNVVNFAIVNVSNCNFPPFVRPPLNFNQSGPLMPVLCNPFNFDLTDRDCRIDEVTFDNASQVWENYVCNVSSSGVCTTVGRVTPTTYNQMTSAVTVSYGLHHYTPFLINLEDCTFVRNTFNSISQNNCPGVRKYGRHIYISLVMISAGAMLSWVF